jgi:hypothetical protein
MYTYSLALVLSMQVLISGAHPVEFNAALFHGSDRFAYSNDATSSPGDKTASTAHMVKLSWNASAPASKSPRDAIVGYIVYRSTKAHDRSAVALSSSKISSTTYTDSTVESGKTYYYVTRAVTAGGTLSGPSNEFCVVVPH